MSHIPPPIQPPSRSMTPLSHQSSMQTLSGADPPRQEHTTTFSHKLINMFSSQVYSLFQASVTIHELANVPQLGGQFTVDWKFRGHKPKAKDLVGSPKTRIGNKPSLPNLKLSAIQASPSSSVASFHTSSTSTTTNSPAIPQPRYAGLPGPRPRAPTNKSMSLPPSALATKDQPTRQGSTVPEKTVEKKASDPTPLRQSITPPPVPIMVQSPSLLDGTIAEPELMDEPRERTDSHSSGGSGSTSGSGSSKARPPKSRLGPSPEIMPRDSSISSNISLPATERARPPSAGSSTSRLAVPGSGISTPGPRSGSTPSVAALVAPPSTDMPPPPLPLTRHISSSTTRSATDSMTSVSSHVNPLRRRTTSGPAPSSQNKSSVHRKGETPAQSLKAHTCTWDYDIEHTLRIPLSKPSTARPSTPGSATPTGRHRQPPAHAQMLGSGPLSESGLRLTIYQVPTPSATSGTPATGANQKSMGSVVHAAHVAAHHSDGQHANPSEGRHGSQSDSIKTVFGTVDIDLAAFAGRGALTRKFLLRGSRTNATIKISVNMQHVGGDDNWAAPPMQEGHHVTGIHDLVGHEAEDRIRGDLALAKTPSNSSSASSFISARTASNPSSADPSRSPSHTDLQSASKHYGGHLQAGDAMHQESRTHSKPPSRTSSYSQSPSSQLVQLSSGSVPQVSGITPAHHYATAHRHHQHRNHLHHLRDRQYVPRDRMEHFPPEFIIEAIFNPTAAKEETPFTFVPPSAEGMTLEGGQAAIQKFIAAAAGNDDTERGSISTQDSKEREEDAAKGATRDKLGWGERMRQRRERKASRKVSKAISTPPIAVD